MRDELEDDLFTDDDNDPIRDTPTPARNPRAWRSIERYREMKELRRHLDDFLLDDLNERSLKDLTL
ncbi:MAG: hypothetical protein R3310_15635 [Candidatus Competibacteraceae bacterium]|nr:hypothetical protein [Candidatus Competibacteraceae bacterium]